MKLILKQHLSGADGVLAVGDTVEVDDATALRYIEKGIAEPKTKKELEAFMVKAEKTKSEQAEKEAQVKAILEKEHITNELNGLYHDVVLKEAELNGVVLEPEQVLELVEDLKKRILPEGGAK